MNTRDPILVISGTRGTGLMIALLLHRQGQRVRVLATLQPDAASVTREPRGAVSRPGHHSDPL